MKSTKLAVRNLTTDNCQEYHHTLWVGPWEQRESNAELAEHTC